MPGKLVLPPIDATPEQIAQRLVHHHLVAEKHLMESCGQPNGSQETKEIVNAVETACCSTATTTNLLPFRQGWAMLWDSRHTSREDASLSTQPSNLTLAGPLPFNS